MNNTQLAQGKALYKKYNGESFHACREESPEDYALFKAVKNDLKLVKELDAEIMEDLFGTLWDDRSIVWLIVGRIIKMLFHDTVDRDYWGSRLLDEMVRMTSLDEKNKILIIERMVGDDREQKKGGVCLFCTKTSLAPRFVSIMERLMDFTCYYDGDYHWNDPLGRPIEVACRYDEAVRRYKRALKKWNRQLD